jgi:hypothetical protein
VLEKDSPDDGPPDDMVTSGPVGVLEKEQESVPRRIPLRTTGRLRGEGSGSAGGWWEYNATARSVLVDDEGLAASETWKERDFRS